MLRCAAIIDYIVTKKFYNERNNNQAIMNIREVLQPLKHTNFYYIKKNII